MQWLSSWAYCMLVTFTNNRIQMRFRAETSMVTLLPSTIHSCRRGSCGKELWLVLKSICSRLALMWNFSSTCLSGLRAWSLRKHVCGASECNHIWELVFFFFKYNWKGKKKPSSAVYLPSTFQKLWAHTSQGHILGFIVHFKLGYMSQQLHLTGRLLKKHEQIQSFSPRNCCPCSAKWDHSSLHVSLSRK